MKRHAVVGRYDQKSGVRSTIVGAKLVNHQLDTDAGYLKLLESNKQARASSFPQLLMDHFEVTLVDTTNQERE